VVTEQRFDTPQPVGLEVKIPAGDIHVGTVEGDWSTVTIEGPPKLVEATAVELAGRRLLIEQRRKPVTSLFGRWEAALHVDVRVPHGSSLEIVTASAGAHLSGDFADLEMKSASGAIRASGRLEGSATVKTVSGDVRLASVAGDLSVRTVSGDVDAESVAGSVIVSSVSGDVRVGSVHEGRVSVHSVSGDVELGIAPGASIEVDAASASGALSSEVPLSDTPVEAGDRTIVIRGNTVSGDFRLFRAA
jgi:hypothetical protein